ncbi:trypsin-like peptidase domain-containing protein [Vibrio vulnificus]|nr:trypsin-like peptidase domain-containing protein [Vibrio vulnificus]EHZ2721964.1 trypsin-like peptidase domain-containing protein [Vibrio vulnificus]EKA7338579.1 trypsin-like peptidase domain-containing protein [Vibrio vulnificus]EME0068112.1 trypsin-like peptidase domain-containing protein [Vibrio vulnificus]
MPSIKKFQTKLEYPEDDKLDRECHWVRPAFEAVDGFGEETLWALQGLIVAFGFIQGEKQHIIGSGIMIAPGLCLTATHVIEETKEKHCFLYSFPNNESMRMWTPHDFNALRAVEQVSLFGSSEERYSDVSVLSYSPLSKFEDDIDYFYSPLEVALPKIGERLWAVGYREVVNDGTPQIGAFVTSGLVTEQFSSGRGSYINGACIEVAMKSLGGMSGGPVFNEEGRVVGVISTCLEGQEDNLGPTYVTLIWPSLISEIFCPWPNGHWPNNLGGIQIEPDSKGVRVVGSVKAENGALKVKFPKQSEESIHELFKSAGVQVAKESEELCDYIYGLIGDHLEEECLDYLGQLNKENIQNAISDTEYPEQLGLFTSIAAYTMEGLEDMLIESAVLLESGTIGLDITYDIRGVFLTLRMDDAEYRYLNEQGAFPDSFHNLVEYEGYITLDHYVRPYIRVSVTYDPLLDELKKYRVHALFIR